MFYNSYIAMPTYKGLITKTYCSDYLWFYRQSKRFHWLFKSKQDDNFNKTKHVQLQYNDANDVWTFLSRTWTFCGHVKARNTMPLFRIHPSYELGWNKIFMFNTVWWGWGNVLWWQRNILCLQNNARCAVQTNLTFERTWFGISDHIYSFSIP